MTQAPGIRHRGCCAAVMLFIAVGLSACAGRPDVIPDSGPVTELGEVPFHPQEENHCGPAALATVLDWHGAAVSPVELGEWLYIPARSGTLQAEMLAEARHRGFPAWAVTHRPELLREELDAGRPVVVLKNLGLGWYPVWHYAVVIGYDPEQQTVILRSGTEERRELAAHRFARFWGRSDYWALVMTEPGEVPAHVDATGYLQAIARFEQSSDDRAALERAWAAGTRTWPTEAGLWLARANFHLERGEVEQAERLLEKGLEPAFEPGPLHHNLAWLLAEQGRHREARAHAHAALASGGAFAERSKALLESLETP